MLCAIGVAALVVLGPASVAEDGKPSMDTLLSAPLERVADTEVIVSRVRIPPNTTLPLHRHPGEEFVYVVAGKVSLILAGSDTTEFAAGDAAHVPLEAVHTARTGDEGVELVVFRVHETGKPERVLVAD